MAEGRSLLVESQDRVAAEAREALAKYPGSVRNHPPSHEPSWPGWVETPLRLASPPWPPELPAKDQPALSPGIGSMSDAPKD